MHFENLEVVKPKTVLEDRCRQQIPILDHTIRNRTMDSCRRLILLHASIRPTPHKIYFSVVVPDAAPSDAMPFDAANDATRAVATPSDTAISKSPSKP